MGRQKTFDVRDVLRAEHDVAAIRCARAERTIRATDAETIDDALEERFLLDGIRTLRRHNVKRDRRSRFLFARIFGRIIRRDFSDHSVPETTRDYLFVNRSSLSMSFSIDFNPFSQKSDFVTSMPIDLNIFSGVSLPPAERNLLIFSMNFLSFLYSA